MPMVGMAPPPAQDVSAQQGPSPFSLAQRPPGPPAPGPGQDPGGDQGGNPIAAQVMTAVIHLQQAMSQEPELQPAFSSAIKTIQVALGNMLGKQDQGGGMGGSPVSSAAPPDSPGVGLPM